ncbi:MAG TPA: peptidase S41 [Anaerolineae bacterium]|nr:peptidase S41 [Anaerolineae bacterium]
MKGKNILFFVILVSLAACLPGAGSKSGGGSGVSSNLPAGAAVPAGPALISGLIEYTNDFVVETYYVEHAVMLTDMTSFVVRDQEWELPIESQVLGYVSVDEDNNRAEYRLALPLVPEGLLNDVDNDRSKDAGLQIFAVAYSPNLTGGVFSEGDDSSFGWPAYLASVTTDSENQDELTGGRLVIWAPDGKQQFPSGFGNDGLLFTADDPLMDVPAGYAIIDLDETPFEIIRHQQVRMDLYEPPDVALKDFSDLSFTEAFNQMYEIVRKEYAFNGIESKQPDWDALYGQLYPRVQEAEDNRDGYAYFLALYDFTLAFRDGHVGLDGGDYQALYNNENILGGYGFAIRELDDGRVLVVYVLPGGPADVTGMRLGAEVMAFNGVPIGQAISQVVPFQPQSTDFGLRLEQSIFLLRKSIGQQAEVTFKNPGGAVQTVKLISVYETESYYAVILGGSLEPYDDDLPVEYQILPQGNGIGYVKVNSNYDDLNLLVRIFERALQTFEDNGIPYLIIDMRMNSGGAPMGLAGLLYADEIPLGQLEYYSDRTGQFEPDGPRDKVLPNVNQYYFDEMVLLVDQFCFSACEIEAYGFSQVPDMVVMGQFPTAGVEAEKARGEFLMPEEMTLNIPTGRFTLPDGSIFLEGVGVEPGIRLPVDEDYVLSDEDVVLQAAVDYMLSQE